MNIVADIGGTKMRIAACIDSEHLGEPIILDTPQSYADAITAFVSSVRNLLGDEQIGAIAVGVPAVLSQDKRSILRSEHLSGWVGHPLVADLEQNLSTTVYLENDTALVGLGEAVYGAGRGSSILTYVTVSTGVNGVRIINGAIDQSTLGFEIGGQYLSIDAVPKTFEQLVSGSAIHEKYGVHPRDLGLESPVWEDLARITAFGIHNTIAHWSPDRVVLGGSMFNEIGISVDRVRAHLETIMKKFPSIPEIVHSSLHDTGGLYGGMARLGKST